MDLLLFDAAERGAPVIEIGFDLHARTRQTRHYGADGDALHLGDLPVGQLFEHDQQKRGALLVNQQRERRRLRLRLVRIV